jgi:hypothetical protein
MMIAMKPSLWGILHDGVVEEIAGSVPGRLTFRISIEWLAEQFGPDSGPLTVMLHDCAAFEFVDFATGQVAADTRAMGGMGLEILSGTQKGDWIEVVTDRGVLRLRYTEITVMLADGREVSLSELSSKADAAVRQWRQSYQSRDNG